VSNLVRAGSAADESLIAESTFEALMRRQRLVSIDGSHGVPSSTYSHVRPARLERERSLSAPAD
jgi:hypothetical protein